MFAKSFLKLLLLCHELLQSSQKLKLIKSQSISQSFGNWIYNQEHQVLRLCEELSYIYHIKINISEFL